VSGTSHSTYLPYFLHRLRLLTPPLLRNLVHLAFSMVRAQQPHPFHTFYDVSYPFSYTLPSLKLTQLCFLLHHLALLRVPLTLASTSSADISALVRAFRPTGLSYLLCWKSRRVLIGCVQDIMRRLSHSQNRSLCSILDKRRLVSYTKTGATFHVINRID